MISLPSMVIAWLKLRQRNLGPILDANGWAVNAKAKINIPFGKSLTGLAALPPGSKRDLRDPYAERHTGRNIVLGVMVILTAFALWYFGVIEKVVPGVLPRSVWVARQEEEKAASAAEKGEAPGAAEKAPAPAPQR
jgi:hypothetical protein